jgi:hypothetical protein
MKGKMRYQMNDVAFFIKSIVTKSAGHFIYP